MTTTICYGDTADGYLENFSATYSTALNGGGTWSVADTAATTVRWGQKFSSPNYFTTEAFLSWSFTVPAGEVVTAAYIRLSASSAANTAVTRALEIREYDWGASMTTADWRTAAQFGALTNMATIDSAQNAGVLYMSAGSSNLVDRLALTSPVRVVCTSDRQRQSTTPSVDEEAYFISSDYGGTGYDPALIFTSVVSHRLTAVLGAQVQLSDGTHAYIENNTVTTPSLTLKHRTTAGTVTSIATLATSTLSDPTEFFDIVDATQSSQKLALAVDSSDNLYVVGVYGGNPSRSVAAQAFTKGVGYTWTAQTLRSAALTSYTDADLNNVAVAWHNVGTSGTIMAVLEHGWGRSPNTTGDGVYALLNCQYLLTAVGSLLRGSGSARGTLVASDVDANNHTNHINPTGTLLDVVAAVSSNDTGYVISPYAYNTGLGDSDTPSIHRYKLNSGGTAISSTIQDYVSYWATKDAAAKARVIAIDSTTFVTVTADYVDGFGIEISQVSGGSFFVQLAALDIDSSNVATLPSTATLKTSQLWDAVYDPTANLLWIYYFDTGNNRRLMRTSVNMSTYLANNNAVEVSSTVGGVGGTNYALRVHRGKLNGQNVLISVANKDSGGTHSTQYVSDTYNLAPTAPTLTTRANFDATAAATFAWTFNDPNPGDTQSAYQLQINTSGGVFEYDTAMVSASVATYVGSGAASTGNNASLTPAVPSGNIGDTLLCFASIRNSGTGTVGTAPAGWQTLLTFGNTAVLGKVADATSESAPTVTFSGGAANEDTLARIHRFRNLPLNIVASSTVLNASAANVGYPALTVPLNASVVFVYGWKQDDWTSVAQLAGMTEIDDTFSTAGNDAAQALDYVIQTTAANISASSFTVTGGASAISRGITLSMGPAGYTATGSSHVLPANTLANGSSWQWRMRTWDAAGLVGPWSSYSTFSTSAGGTVTITSPATDNPGGQITDDYTITWSVSGTTQAYYRVKVVKTSDSSTLSDTGFVASVATSAGISGLLSGSEYRVEVTVRNAGLVDSGTGTRLITPAYSNPDTPTVTLSTPDGGGYILVTVDNPVPTGDKPLPSTNQIRRRVYDSGDDYQVIGTCAADGTYRDYTAASGVTYEYVVRAVAV